MLEKQNETGCSPLVGIGLPVRNGAAYLREALESLIAQTHKNIELVISDNVSGDNTQKICEEYARKDPRIRYIRQKESLASFTHFDFVRSKAGGDYFMWACHDDLWDPRFIEKCLAKYKEASSANSGQDPIVVFPNFCTFDDSGKVMKYNQKKYFPFSLTLYKRIRTYLLFKLTYGKDEIRYGLWKRGAPADKLLASVDRDNVYVLKALLTGYFAAVPETLFFKRIPAQPPVDVSKRRTSLQLLTALPHDYPFETPDDWVRTRKRGLSFKTAAKEFVANRIQAAKYSYLFWLSIFQSPALSGNEKAKLFFWNLYSYLRSFWSGHV